ncbi:hypothetical protein AZE42_11143 [Rhizopogon vesiculosus]|uniref:Uncharacterized protein n=1 Tax=Rhizopogon vesiculosus TaxID=180088 RepID=A0A1J8PJR0_9AGAM|nr:hypothetical protein AZE42_11143 [Rhizopogon vesiculosus]
MSALEKLSRTRFVKVIYVSQSRTKDFPPTNDDLDRAIRTSSPRHFDTSFITHSSSASDMGDDVLTSGARAKKTLECIDADEEG